MNTKTVFARTMTAILTAAVLTLTTGVVSAQDAPTSAPQVEEVSTKSPWLAATLNFFIPGAGYLYNNEKPLYVSIPMILGAGGLTYVEQIHKFESSGKNLLGTDKTAFFVMFGAVFALNTGAAIDAFMEADAINARAARQASGIDLNVGVSVLPEEDGEGASYGLSLGGSW